MKLTNNQLNMTRNMLTRSYGDIESINNPFDGSIYKPILMFDISYFFDILERVSEIHEVLDFEDYILEDEDRVKIAYQILNVSAHYRHYFNNKIKMHNVIILYCSHKYHYHQFKKTLSLLNKLITLFKKMIFIEDIGEEGNQHRPYIYNHLAYYTLQKVVDMNNTVNNKCIIVWIGNSIIDYQYLNIQMDRIFNITSKDIKEGFDIVFNKHFLTVKPKNLDDGWYKRNGWQFRHIINYLIAVLGGKGGPVGRLRSYARKKSLSIMLMVEDCIKTHTSDIDVDEFQYLFVKKEEDVSTFQSRYQQTSVERNSDIRITVDKLMKIWNSKLETDSTYSLNDIFEFDDDTNLKVEWLMEY